MTQYIVHLGTGTVLCADEVVVVDITTNDLSDDAIIELAEICGSPIMREI